MHSVSVETGFSALHQLRLATGALEPLHGHDWRVRAVFVAPTLDDLGMVVDFHEAEAVLRAAVRPFDHANLNQLPVFAGRNPTAEVVSKIVFDRIGELGLRRPARVEVTESPGCVACFDPTLRVG
ncbi:MAG: 6-carboxytetrahydropterin synthase [Planctomycetota bacterium]